MTRYKPAPEWTRRDMQSEMLAALSAAGKGESADGILETLMMSLDRYVQDERERIAQAIEVHAEGYGDPADNAYEYVKIARQAVSES